MSNFHELSYEKITQWEGLINYYTKEEIEEARKNPVFIHFSGTSVTRPWHNPDFIYRNIYEEYASLTKNEKEIFKDDKKIDPFEKIRYNFYKTKLVGLVFMFIPKKIFVKNANRTTIIQEITFAINTFIPNVTFKNAYETILRINAKPPKKR